MAAQGSFFGELAVLNDDGLAGSDVIRTRTVQAVSDCDLVFLTKRDMHGVQAEYPELDAQLRRFVQLREQHMQDFKEHRMAKSLGGLGGKGDGKDGTGEARSMVAMNVRTLTEKITAMENDQFDVQRQYVCQQSVLSAPALDLL